MQARFSTPSSLAAHHRRLMASCAESGCPQVRQRSGAKLSARTVGESLCMSKSVEARLQGPDSERQGPTNRMSAAMFSGSPHSTRHDIWPNRAPSRLRSSRRGDPNAKAKRSSRNGHWARHGVAGDTFPPGCSRPILGLDLRHDIRSAYRKGVSRFRGLRPEPRRGPTSLVAVGWWCCGSPA
jgi:hypothetical protein